MKNIFAKLSLILILTSTLNSFPALAENFTDLSSFHKNYQAINYLKDEGILNGYTDNTFRPAQEVTRAEFLKIVMEGSNINLATNDEPLPFSDNPNNWSTPYIKKAYEQGWINGYSDNTFRPHQTITKVESLKILGMVQEWNLPRIVKTELFEDTIRASWYAPYIAYAKENSYLEETGNLFEPTAEMTRANISEVIYRTATSEAIDDDDPDEDEDAPEDDNDAPDNDDEDEDPEEDPTATYISKTFYEDIELSSNLPDIFYKNEVYIIEGEVQKNNINSATIILEGKTNNYYKTFSTDLDGDDFEIAVFFPKTGDYNIGILAGESGTSKAQEITVKSSLPSSENESSGPKTSSLDLEFENDHTYVEFNTDSSSIKKIKFTQNNEKVTYYSRQNKKRIPVSYADFEDFEEGTIIVSVESAELKYQNPLVIDSEFGQEDEESFRVIEHSFSQIETDSITVTPPETYSNKQEISFSGKAEKDLKQKAYVIKPDGFVDTLFLETSTSRNDDDDDDEIVEDGKSFTFSYTPETSGRYILEINDKNSLPVLNHPVYIGSKIPLIPDYFDLNDRNLYDGNLTIEDAREDLLSYINESRDKHDLDPVDLASDLNELAQGHSDDMAENNFFSHVNPDGQSPDQRRTAAGIATPVSENIAKDVEVIFAHWGLMRSASHRKNILTKDWTLVGIGIAENNGYLYISEEFSGSTPNEETLENYEDELLEEINKLRSDNNKEEFTLKNSVNQTAKYVNDKMIDEEASLTEDLLAEASSRYEVSGSYLTFGRVYNLWDPILDSILEENDILSTNWNYLGLNLQLSTDGNLNLILILN
jgi:hypothetical protein